MSCAIAWHVHSCKTATFIQAACAQPQLTRCTPKAHTFELLHADNGLHFPDWHEGSQAGTPPLVGPAGYPCPSGGQLPQSAAGLCCTTGRCNRPPYSHHLNHRCSSCFVLVPLCCEHNLTWPLDSRFLLHPGMLCDNNLHAAATKHQCTSQRCRYGLVISSAQCTVYKCSQHNRLAMLTGVISMICFSDKHLQIRRICLRMSCSSDYQTADCQHMGSIMSIISLHSSLLRLFSKHKLISVHHCVLYQLSEHLQVLLPDEALHP